MALKTLLTHVRADAGAQFRLKAAVALARDHDALLIGLGANVIPSYLIDPYGVAVADWMPLVAEQQATDLAAAHETFKRLAEGVRSAWITSSELPTLAMARAARAADLLIIGGAPAKRDPYSEVDQGELVVTAGRPVLVVPPTGGELSPRRVMIAWNDSRESRRATADALPLLLLAESIVILALRVKGGLDNARIQADEVAGWLRRQGAAPALTQVGECQSDLIDAEILARAEAAKADLIVAGGYGHNRAAEWVLGGVTRELLRHPPRFVLLSH